MSNKQPAANKDLLTNQTARDKEFTAHHSGHEGTHLLMVLFLLSALIGAQYGLLEWRKRKPKSYAQFSFVGLALVPPALALAFGFWRFIICWALFALANSWVIFRASQSPLSSRTPRLVYRWFTIVYRLCYAMGIGGYVAFVLTILGVTSIFVDGVTAFSVSVTLLFYGFYFGVLSRDLVEVISDRMASTIGYYSSTGLPQKYLRENVCAVCGADISASLDDEAESSPDRIIQLDCKHQFHEQCIRGWTIIGKRVSCPYCGEKVNLDAFTMHAWDKTQMYYLQVIDMLRYLVVWQPVIFLAVQGLYKLLGLD